MAMGEWLSVQSARELYERQIGIEADELAVAPQEEAEELALIYEAKGLPAEEARSVANRLIADPSMALDTLAREELGLNPDELGGSAWVAAGVSFALFSIGALIPVVPFVFLAGSPAVLTSVTVSMLTLFLLGAGITLLTGQRALTSGSRQVLIGMAAAGLTYALGRLLGISLRG
jgi:VIT1/CCC1 family predicted Fe2+/Mn2+ transporter